MSDEVGREPDPELSGLHGTFLAHVLVVVLLPCWGCVTSSSTLTSHVPDLAQGRRVRIESPSGRMIEGPVSGQAPDSLWIATGLRTLGGARSTIVRVEVPVDRLSTTFVHTLAGAGIGWFMGSLVAATDREQCTRSFVEGSGMFVVESRCSGGDSLTSAPRLLMAVGTGIGLVIGLTGPRWKVVYGPPRFGR